MNYGNIRLVSQHNNIAEITVQKYIGFNFSEPLHKRGAHNKKQRMKEINDYSNIIYKMLQDKIEVTDILAYVKEKCLSLTESQIYQYITTYSKTYFNKKHPTYLTYLKRVAWKYEDDILVITRNELLRYLTTIKCNKKKSKIIRHHIGILRKKYPIIQDIESMFNYFSNCLKEKKEDSLNKFIAIYEKHDKKRICTFINGIKMDIAAVKAAISTKLNSGFVEGGNNKIKLIKRMCYGRLKYRRLAQRCLLAFNYFL